MVIFMKEEIKKYWVELTTGIKTMFKEFFNKETNKKQRANMWTFTRFIIPVITLILSIIAVSTCQLYLLLGAGAVAASGALTDYLDGKSARKHNSSSDFGKILDQATDKFFAGVIGINLLFLNFNYIYTLLLEGIIAATNITYKLIDKDMSINSTMVGKVKEWPLFVSLALGFLAPISPTMAIISNCSIALTSLFQIGTIASYIKSNTEELKKLKESKETETNVELEETDNSNEKEKVLEKDEKNTRTKQCEELKKLRDQLIEIANQKQSVEKNENNFQKIKK